MIGAVFGLVAAGILAGAAFWLLMLGRRRGDPDFDHRVHLPVVGMVGVPTLLATGVALALCAYHSASFSLAALGQDVLPTPLSPDRWWVLPLGLVVVVVLSRIADQLESDEEPAAKPDDQP